MTTSGNSMDDWQELARQSWETWRDVVGASRPNSGDAHVDDTAPEANDTASETAERMLKGLRHWQHWLQSMAAADLSGDDGLQALRQAFERANTCASFGSDAAQGAPFDTALKHMLDLWQAPFAEAFDAFGLAGLGRTTQYQRLQQDMMRAMRDMGEHLRRYQALMARANLAGIDRLQHTLDANAAAQRPIDTLRELYDLWVDCAEKAYADVALSAEFRDVYGALLNAQIQVRALRNKQVAQWARQMGMPTRDDVDSLGQRLQQMRRDWRASRAGELADEVASLRNEVKTLRAELARNPAKAVAKKRSSATTAATSGGQNRRKSRNAPVSGKHRGG